MQVFTFLLKTDRVVWSKLDWAKVTTLCYAGWHDPDLTALAHQHGARGEMIDRVVIRAANYPLVFFDGSFAALVLVIMFHCSGLHRELSQGAVTQHNFQKVLDQTTSELCNGE